MSVRIYRETTQKSKWTYSIPEVRNTIQRYQTHYPMDKHVWINVTAGPKRNNVIVFAKHANDLDPNINHVGYNLEIRDFCKLYRDKSVDVILFDPPFSTTMLKRHYNNIGIEKIPYELRLGYPDIWNDDMYRILKPGGIIIKTCYNSSKIKPDMEILETFLMNHGRGNGNDTILTVQRKPNSIEEFFEEPAGQSDQSGQSGQSDAGVFVKGGEV